MSITDWDIAEHLRKRMLLHGAHVLSPAEAISFFLHTGLTGQGAVNLASNLLHRFNGMQGLCLASLGELMRVSGMGLAKSCQIGVLTRVMSLYLLEDAKISPVLLKPEKVYELIKCSIRDRSREEFWALMLTGEDKLKEMVFLNGGSVNGVYVHPRELIKEVLRVGVGKVILAHNHPSGNPHPSELDKKTTERLARACDALDTKLVDHLIAGDNSFFSFKVACLL